MITLHIWSVSARLEYTILKLDSSIKCLGCKVLSWTHCEPPEFEIIATAAGASLCTIGRLINHRTQELLESCDKTPPSRQACNLNDMQ